MKPKQYRLKYDLPTFKAGGTFHLNDRGDLISDNEFSKGVVAYARSSIVKFPNILTDWFEEIKPADPLIKDEKIRKAVRAWAEADGADEKIYLTIDDNGSRFANKYGGYIEFAFQIDMDERLYTIDELCGEEE